MNRFALSGAAALATLLAAGPAQATVTIGGITFDTVVFTSGASAARIIPPAVAGSTALCAGPVYKWNWSGKPADYKITGCQWDATGTTVGVAATIPAALGGKRVAIISRSDGGSLFGVRELAVPATMAHVDPSTCVAGVANGAEQTCTGTVLAQSDVGISDEDGGFLCGVSGLCTVAQRNAISSGAQYKASPIYQIGWEIQVGANFPMTSLSKASVTGIFNGSYTTVAQVQAANGVAATSTENLKVCIRDATSGTQAAHRFLWTGASYCGNNTSLGFVADSGAGSCPSNDTYCVEANSSSSGVPTCLTGTASADDNRSIGVVNITNLPVAGAKKIAVDGITSNTANLVRGTWTHYSESTAQYNTLTQVNNVYSTAAEKIAFDNFFPQLLSDPSLLNSAGIEGVAGDLNVSPVALDPTPAAGGTGWTTKNGNNCALPLPIYP